MRASAALVLALLLAIPGIVHAQDRHACASNGDELQQLRIYEINRDNKDDFHKRFQHHALRIMQRYGFRVVDAWESDTGEKIEFVYILAWPDRATMDASWAGFLADQEWIDIKKRTGAESGQLVRKANGQPLRRVSYSPACSPK